MSAAPALSAAPAELLRVESDSGVVTLTLASPQNRNALGLTMIDTLIVALADIGKNASARVIILTGDGPALSAGHDLKEMQAHRNDRDRGETYFEHLFARCSTLMQAVVASPKPIIACVEGIATAAGCQLVASCDLAVAGEKARFALSGVNAGLFCSTPLVAVSRAVQRKAALEMALTGKMFSADDALRFGLVNRVVPEGTALASAQALAREIAEHSAASLAIGKRAFYAQIEQPLDVAYGLAGRAMIENLAEADCVEGMAAFIEKRKPNYGAGNGPAKGH
jgi:enoyl-CoA hydratase/carnithine racemase